VKKKVIRIMKHRT